MTSTTTTKGRTEHDRLVTVAKAAVDTGIANGKFLASKRDLLRTSCESNATLCEWVTAAAIESVAAAVPTSLADEALLAASRARMGGEGIAARAEVVREASLSIESTGAPRLDGRYDSAALSSDEVPGTPRSLGLSDVDPPAQSSSAPAVVTASGVAVDAYGGMTYEGLPVTTAADGSPRVHVTAGAMSIETLRSLGIDLEYERLLYVSRCRMGTAA